MDNTLKGLKILIKGAGEMATGIAHRLFMANFKRILMTEIERPISVRRTVAFSEAVYEKIWAVEGISAELVNDVEEIEPIWGRERIGVIVDPKWLSLIHI
ncbi:MAG: hypothetical protein N3D15_09195, partial [Syntrophorhabdaceae bacterium]|nr:hypothetical protein [Syntrophorhabdaceae bacterium]